VRQSAWQPRLAGPFSRRSIVAQRDSRKDKVISMEYTNARSLIFYDGLFLCGGMRAFYVCSILHEEGFMFIEGRFVLDESRLERL
jgi:hypothetical protein